ncbi:fungal-specific transcription factor domain-containing protein [Hypoxylon sp. FL1284]|nr:fungal-specific transcription factor domain-containing protein [Hypoxylon sp. FL1284]
MYTPTSQESGSQEPLGSPTKRRHVDSSPRMLKLESGQTIAARTPSIATWSHNTDRQSMSIKTEAHELGQAKLTGANRNFIGSDDREIDAQSRISTTVSTISGATDEAELGAHPRMLEDGTRRLQYVGESGSLSYLQLIRMIVSSVAGDSEFTQDIERHNIVENTIQLAHGVKPTGVLPDRNTANVLIESFFVNTSGFIEVFHKDDFLQAVEEFYNKPLSASQEDLCKLHLVFAIGLAMACPLQGTEAGAVIQTLQSERINRAELFYLTAIEIYGPATGFEDADFWSVQALLLMSLYLLAVSRRNASYIRLGMAIHSAKSLGLHREESMEIFYLSERQLRRNVWRSLFILDNFLAASLGRPVTISEADCSEHALDLLKGATADEPAMSDDTGATNSTAVDAAVKSSRLIGTTLRRIYSRRKISTVVGKEMTDQLEVWEREMHKSLHCRRIVDRPMDTAEPVAVLHVNLLHCHSVLLLTRPFFLFLIKRGYRMGLDDESSPGTSQKPSHASQILERLERFSPVCIDAAQRTIILARAALDAEYLPQCNPFVIYFVFAAALIILSNEFTSLYHIPDTKSSIESTLRILEYCEQRDVQAKRVRYIIQKFHEANQERPSRANISLPGRKKTTISTDSQSFLRDPTSYFFYRAQADRQRVYVSNLSPTKELAAVHAPATQAGSRMLPMIQPTLQQPSPEESVSLNNGIAAASMAPGMEGLVGGESEFDFDILLQGWSTPSANHMGMHPLIHPAEAYGSYGLPQPPPPLPQGGGLHHHVPPPYAPSDYLMETGSPDRRRQQDQMVIDRR